MGEAAVKDAKNENNKVEESFIVEIFISICAIGDAWWLETVYRDKI